jgi:hypothetical protein
MSLGGQQQVTQRHVAVHSRVMLSSLVFPVRASLNGFVILMDDVGHHPECNGTAHLVEKRFKNMNTWLTKVSIRGILKYSL